MKAMYFERVKGCLQPTMADLVGPDQEGKWLITRINVPVPLRGQGLATKLLKEILSDADEEGVTLELWPYASGANSGGLNQTQLTGWYARHGFVKQKIGVMVRTPQ